MKVIGLACLSTFPLRFLWLGGERDVERDGVSLSARSSFQGFCGWKVKEIVNVMGLACLSAFSFKVSVIER